VDGIVGQQTWGSLGGDRFEGSAPRGAGSVSGGGGGGGEQVTAYVNGQPRQITVVPVGNGQYMRADAASHFKEMMAAARNAGHDLYAESGFRTMAKQQYLYNGWIHHEPGFNLAARPGYSNHQNGIAMDIGGVGGYGSSAYRWLSANAGRFGFTNDVGGEYWHFDYRG
jgi:LAS superfamily LD-carboxypeptidase LdcB